MNADFRTIVVVATYNEIENLPRLVDEIFRFAPDVDVLIVDDNSPDGTGSWSENRAKDDSRVHFIHRESKLGLGTATVEGFRFALDNEYDLVLTMDADFSHQPEHLTDLLQPFHEDPNIGVVIGSRYVQGGGIRGWPLHRRLMSRALNLYARFCLAMPVQDNSGAFRCYRAELLRQLEFDTMLSRGYSYLEELLWLLKRVGAHFLEVPITFVDREQGNTKINMREAISAVAIITRFGVKNWTGI